MKKQKFQMRKLIDKWTPIVFILFCFIKILQTLKNWGISPEYGGWRSAMNAFSRAEHSKFTLAVFHLDIFSNTVLRPEHKTFDESRDHLIKRLHAFLKAMPESHWQLVWKKYHAVRKKKKQLDIIAANFDNGGNLLSIDPHFDPNSTLEKDIPEAIRLHINQKIVEHYNASKNINDKRRPWALKIKINKWILLQKNIKKRDVLALMRYVDHVLSGAFIHFSCLPGPDEASLNSRFIDPPFIKLKHPGHGLLNIHARFTHDFNEADLWFQFHHVPVDGVPMQEILNELKKSWGTSSELKFPSIQESPTIVSELCSTEKEKKAIYQAKQFIDFGPFLDIRKKLNAEHSKETGFSITAVGMLMWGLTHHEFLYGRKFMFTVEMPALTGRNQERSPGLVIIRPSLYFNKANPRKGFLRFQKILDERIEATRQRRSESYELMESYALTTPFLYKLIQKLFPRSFSEFVGTIGITMIRDSDHFTTPLSDINPDGFLAFGNFSVPTEDGGRAGVVTARGTKTQVENYLAAVKDVAADFYKYC